MNNINYFFQAHIAVVFNTTTFLRNGLSILMYLLPESDNKYFLITDLSAKLALKQKYK